MADTVDLTRITEYEETEKTLNKKITKLTKLIQNSKYVVFFTGAGVSTSAGVPDYRGPKGCWTMKAQGKKAESKVDMVDAQPTPTHMAMATLINKGLARYVVTTNLDGLHRKSGLKAHKQICNLHGCIYVERCTGCGYDFERNWHVRKGSIHVHDHYVGKCERCGSDKPKDKGRVGTKDENCGTKDTHINFGEYLDPIEWKDADKHCGKSDLVIVAGTSLTLRHITHLPFEAHKNGGKVVIINLQKTPDDDICDLRIFSKTDCVFEEVMKRLNIEIEPIPVWRPRDSKAINKLPKDLNPYYVKAAERLELCAQMREKELKNQKEEKTKQVDEKEQEQITKNIDKLKINTKKDKEEEKIALVIGNTHKEKKSIDKNSHQWSLYVKGINDGLDLSSHIEKVDFTLHPTFSPPLVTVTEEPFCINRTGWGTFETGIKIYWKNGKSSQFAHTLNFKQPITESVVLN